MDVGLETVNRRDTLAAEAHELTLIFSAIITKSAEDERVLVFWNLRIETLPGIWNWDLGFLVRVGFLFERDF